MRSVGKLYTCTVLLLLCTTYITTPHTCGGWKERLDLFAPVCFWPVHWDTLCIWQNGGIIFSQCYDGSEWCRNRAWGGFCGAVCIKYELQLICLSRWLRKVTRTFILYVHTRIWMRRDEISSAPIYLACCICLSIRNEGAGTVEGRPRYGNIWTARVHIVNQKGCDVMY